MNTYHKICTKCKTSKPVMDFDKDKSRKDGYVYICKICKKEHYENKRQSRIEYQKEYYTQNRVHIQEYKKEYQQQNKCSIREYHNEYRKAKYTNDELYYATVSIRTAIRKSLKNNSYTKKSRTHEILGCSYAEFKIHIENQFTEGMHWDNRSKWHLDHITPISWGKTEEEIIALNHYTNFQPLWAEDNLSKGNRFSGKSQN